MEINKNDNFNYPIAQNFKRNPNIKPDAKLVGENGNVFNLLAICKRSLRHMPNAFNELWERVTNCHSYDEALVIMHEYVNII